MLLRALRLNSVASTRLAVTPFLHDINQRVKPAVSVLLRLSQFSEALFIFNLRVDHDRDLVVLLPHLAPRAQPGAHQQLCDALESIKSFFVLLHGIGILR